MNEKTINNKFRGIGIGIITIIILSFSWYLIERFSYSKELPFYSVASDNEKTLTIGIIGDSWVSGGKLDSLLQNGLLVKGYKNKILSSGQPGAKSNIIYQNLFEAKENLHSSKFIIENRPDYCIIIAGVNDAASQIGGKFYSYHMSLIIKTLLHYKIKPIIVSCPEFGINESINQMNVLSKRRNIISAYFNNNGEIDNIKTYRKILAEELYSENLIDSVILIEFGNVCSDYNKCPELYINPSHLSKKGNKILCQVITNKLIAEINGH
jgi:hypothetical protein